FVPGGAPRLIPVFLRQHSAHLRVAHCPRVGLRGDGLHPANQQPPRTPRAAPDQPVVALSIVRRDREWSFLETPNTRSRIRTSASPTDSSTGRGASLAAATRLRRSASARISASLQRTRISYA